MPRPAPGGPGLRVGQGSPACACGQEGPGPGAVLGKWKDCVFRESRVRAGVERSFPRWGQEEGEGGLAERLRVTCPARPRCAAHFPPRGSRAGPAVLAFSRVLS